MPGGNGYAYKAAVGVPCDRKRFEPLVSFGKHGSPWRVIRPKLETSLCATKLSQTRRVACFLRGYALTQGKPSLSRKQPEFQHPAGAYEAVEEALLRPLQTDLPDSASTGPRRASKASVLLPLVIIFASNEENTSVGFLLVSLNTSHLGVQRRKTDLAHCGPTAVHEERT